MNENNFGIDRQIRTVLSASQDYSALNVSPILKNLKTVNRTKLDGMFGVKFGERVPSDVATLTDGTDGTLMAFFEPKSPELTFIQYCKVLLPLSRVVCGIQGVTNFPDDEKDKCFETYEKYKKELGRRYGEMTTLRKKMGLSEIDGSEEICQSIVECDDKRIITLQIRNQADGKYLLRLIALDLNLAAKAVEEKIQVSTETIPLEGLFGQKLGAHADVSEEEVQNADGTRTRSFEPDERFLDFESYQIQFFPRSRKICLITAVHSCATKNEAFECFRAACRQLEKTFNQKMVDTTAGVDTTHPDEDGELALQVAVLSFPNTLRLLGVELLKNVNEGTFLVRISAFDQKMINTFGAEVRETEDKGSEVAKADLELLELPAKHKDESDEVVMEHSVEKTQASPTHDGASALFGPIERLRRAAEQGDIDAQYNLGNKYYIGLGMDEDKEEAVKWYRKAAEQGHVGAQINLAACYASGDGVKQDKPESVRWLRKAAEQNDAIAQLKVGFCYQNGDGAAQDKAEAVKWYRKAAEQGNMYGQEVLGNCYRDGIGVDQDMAEAVKWYRKAAEQDEADAQYNLGLCLLYGKGTAKNPKEAADWFEKAAEQDNLNACYEIGRAYERGNGRTKNMNKATEWYQKGAATGNYGCCVQLGFRYLRGDCSTIKKDVDKALELFLQSIKGNQNGIWAYHGAGLAYLERAQGLSDSQKAVEMFRKAADRGLSESQHCLGKCYETGRGIIKSLKEAEEWYRKAAEQGHKNAKQALKRLGVDSE